MHQNAGAARGERHALHLLELIAGVHAPVNTGARAGVNVGRVLGVDDDRKHVGIINDALVHMRPSLAAISSLPWQMPGSGINDIGIQRVDSYRLEILKVRMMIGSYLFPSIAAVHRAMHAIKRAYDDDLRVRGRKLQCADRFSAHALQGLPRLTTVGRAEKVTGTVVGQAPGRNVNLVGIGGIDGDVIEDVVLARPEVYVT